LNHDSALATLLIQRAFRCRHRIGHSFFWLLKSEMHIPSIAERYGLMLESYLRGAGSHRKELRDQVKAMDMLVDVAVKIKVVTTKQINVLFFSNILFIFKQATPVATRLKVQRDMLAALQFPPVFQLPLDPRLQVCGLKSNLSFLCFVKANV
jgi:phosphatidylinositol-4,5-bisphosphate 3-kinase